MSQSHCLSALIAKRAELAGEIEALAAQLTRKRADLVHLDATMRLIDSSFVPETIRPKRQKPPGPDLFGRKELPRLVLEALRGADGPLRSMEIARAVMARRGLPDDAALLRRVENMVDGALRRREGRMVERVWNGRALGWRTAIDQARI